MNLINGNQIDLDIRIICFEVSILLNIISSNTLLKIGSSEMGQ